MSGFEFLVVLLSIVFGLALTQFLSGAMRLLNEESIDDVRLVWASTMTLMVVINWWGFIGWGDFEGWRFEQYTFLLLWASAHYAVAASLFPDRDAVRSLTGRQRRVFYSVVLVTLAMDVGEAALREALANDPAYAISMLGWGGLVLVTLVVDRRSVDRLAGWLFLVSGVAFALLERGTFVG